VKYKYYGVRGRMGYVHAECWPAYEAAHTRYDAQGWPISRPSFDSQLVTFRGIRQHRCLHCDRPLLAKPPQPEQPSTPAKSQTEGYFDLIRNS
jgi:hypothetical protein